MKKLVLNFCFLFFVSNAAFATPEQDVDKFINDLGNKIIKIADNKKISVDQRKDQLIQLIDTVIDPEWLARFVLAKHYKTASPEQKEKFKKLYREFMINTYGPKFKGYNGEKFEVKSVTSQNSYYIAKCLFYPKDSQPVVSIDFRVKKQKDSDDYLILDIVAEGVSLIETQRSEFGSAISTSGLDNFMNDLEVRIKKLKLENKNKK